jgi:hypothetical protein
VDGVDAQGSVDEQFADEILESCGHASPFDERTLGTLEPWREAFRLPPEPDPRPGGREPAAPAALG